jgi:hypothetical protein
MLSTIKAMENTDPKDEQITNDDNSVTNKDGNNNLEKGQPPNPQKGEQDEQPDNDIGDATMPEEEAADSSNVGKGPAGENL